MENFVGDGNFTEYFSTYYNNNTTLADTCMSALASMPDDENGISFKQRFMERNCFKEIGSETEELFTMHLTNACREVVEDYLWKIDLFNDNVENLMKRYVELSSSGETVDETFKNPIVSGSTSQTGVITDKYKSSFSNTLQHAYGFFKSNPEIMDKALKLKDIYTQALESMDNLFMRVL